MILNIYNLPGRDELETRQFWLSRIDAMCEFYDYPELFKSLWVDVYHREHPDRPFKDKQWGGVYTHENKRVCIFARPDNLNYYLDVLAHEIGHYIGHQIGFNYNRTHIETKLTEKFKELIPEKTDQSEYFATHCANISGATSDNREYSKHLVSLMRLCWPLHEHLSDKIFERLTVESDGVRWKEYAIENVLWWPVLKDKGWFKFTLAGQFQKYSNGQWLSI
jgi:hypothetical protein